MLIEHNATAIRHALQDKQAPNVYVRFVGRGNPLRIIDVALQHGAVKVKTLVDGKWRFIDDRDYIYSMR